MNSMLKAYKQKREDLMGSRKSLKDFIAENIGCDASWVINKKSVITGNIVDVSFYSVDEKITVKASKSKKQYTIKLHQLESIECSQ